MSAYTSAGRQGKSGRGKRRKSWTEQKTAQGETYYYDDPDLGGSGDSTWDTPDELRTAQTAASSTALKKYMKRRSVIAQYPEYGDNFNAWAKHRLKERLKKLRSRQTGGAGATAAVTANSDWQLVNAGDGSDSYWYNTSTGESSWTDPRTGGGGGAEAAAAAASQQYYYAIQDDSGATYYQEYQSGECVWELPAGAQIITQ